MKVIRVTMYQCEHCGKRKFKRPQMMRHEKICLRNPARHCPTCGENFTMIPQVVRSAEKLGLTDDPLCYILDATKECPHCTLAAVLMYNAEIGLGEEKLLFDYVGTKVKWEAKENEYPF